MASILSYVYILYSKPVLRKQCHIGHLVVIDNRVWFSKLYHILHTTSENTAQCTEFNYQDDFFTTIMTTIFLNTIYFTTQF